MSSTLSLQSGIDANSIPQYYIVRTGDVTADYCVTDAGKATKGWCRLMSGIILKWGSGTVAAGSSGTVTFDTTAPFTNVFSPGVSLAGSVGISIQLVPIVITAFTTTQMTVYSAGLLTGTLTYYYQVIGN